MLSETDSDAPNARVFDESPDWKSTSFKIRKRVFRKSLRLYFFLLFKFAGPAFVIILYLSSVFLWDRTVMSTVQYTNRQVYYAQQRRVLVCPVLSLCTMHCEELLFFDFCADTTTQCRRSARGNLRARLRGCISSRGEFQHRCGTVVVRCRERTLVWALLLGAPGHAVLDAGKPCAVPVFPHETPCDVAAITSIGYFFSRLI